MKKKTAKQIVAESAETLRGMSVGELTKAGKAAGFDSRAGFAAWKRALAEAGINYESLRDERREERAEAAEASITHRLTLYSDAKASAQRFAVCAADGSPVWYGRFFDDDRDFNGEQSSGEIAAAKKAVWLASQAAAQVGGVVGLTLFVDAEWLTYANSTDPKVGGKARELRGAAERLGVVLTVVWVAGSSNPADAWTTSRGFARWSDYSIAAMIEGRAEKIAAEPAPAAAVAAPVVVIETPAPAPITLPITDEQVARLRLANIADLAAMTRRQRKDYLFTAGLPNHAAALDHVAAMLAA